MTKKLDDLEEGRKCVENLMRSAIEFEDKLKAFDRWVKFKDLEQRRKSGGMGSGFEDLSVEHEL